MMLSSTVLFRLLFVVFFLLYLAMDGAAAGIATSKHNLSISGSGTVKASTEDRICIFCHITHGAIPIAPLWNRANSGATYIPYSSSTAAATFGQPTGASLLCLSCHDGTIALGEVVTGDPITLIGGLKMPQGKGLIGTDLSDDHPVSFNYGADLLTKNPELANPGTLTGPVKLDSTGQVQCTSCHDPHNDDFGKFLVMDNRGSTLCEACHKKNSWLQSPHKISTATWSKVGNDPWPNSDYVTVGDNGCSNCHTNHSAKHPERLLNEITEEDICLGCHNNTVGPDVATDFNKLSRHPIGDTLAVHAFNEPTLVSNRHVECVDCHNAHGAGIVVGVPGVRGIDILGSPISPVAETYQLCFRCHGDSPNLPTPSTNRLIAENNVRQMFNPANSSFHPVAAVGKNQNVPSLISPWTTASRMGCDGCHGSDTGISSPHGSNNPSILRLRFETADNTNESPAVYALCYSCHDRNSILGNNTFGEHQLHIVNEQASCNICHDPHGLSAAAGANGNNTKLINFDINVVLPEGGTIRHTANAGGGGSCTLNCHGQAHNNETY